MGVKEYFKKVKEFTIKRYGNGWEGYQNTNTGFEDKIMGWLWSKIKKLFGK